jgi:hypothetical protein
MGSSPDDRFPLAVRALIIGGLAATSWTIIASLVAWLNAIL